MKIEKVEFENRLDRITGELRQAADELEEIIEYMGEGEGECSERKEKSQCDMLIQANTEIVEAIHLIVSI